MKKFMKIIYIIIMAIMLLAPVANASSYKTIDLQLKVTKNVNNANFNMYMLLPKDYIVYAINNANLNIEYDGPNTLKENTIIGINVEKSKIQDETYNEDGIEYVQILLEPTNNNIYNFKILSDYNKLDMKFRVKNDEKDYIMHIDNFKTDDNECKMEYNYDQNQMKQSNKIVINFGTLLLIVILVLIISVAIISKIKTKN